MNMSRSSRDSPKNNRVAAGPSHRARRRVVDASANGSTIHGVAFAADDRVEPNGHTTRWTPAALAAMASTLEGRPLTDRHTDRDPHATVGEITESWFDEDAEAVRFRASLADDELARKINSGLLELSPRVGLPDDLSSLDTDDDGTRVVDESGAREFYHLAIVPRTERSGAHTRAQTGPGPSPPSASSPAVKAFENRDSAAVVDADETPNAGRRADASDTARSPAVAAFESRNETHTVGAHDSRESGDSDAHTDAADDENNLVQRAASARVLLAAGARGESAAEFVERRYGVTVGDYDDADTLRRDLADAEADDDGTVLDA